MRLEPAFFVLACIASAAPLAAQSKVATLYGAPEAGLGSSVASIADLNGDGVREIVVGMSRASTPNGAFSGRVRVYSGAFLLHGILPDVLYEWDGDPGEGVHFGGAIAAGGDVDADGVPDIAVGATGDDQGGLSIDCGSVRVFSGATGAILGTFYGGGHKGLGISVAFVGDVNHDGYDDVAGGATGFSVGPTFPGKAWVWSGEWMASTAAGLTPASPMILHALTGDAGGDYYGASVAPAGDLDLDGFADFAVGARQGGINGGGYVRIYSGATGAVLASLDGDKPFVFFGATLARAGDVNGDGWPDLAIGAPGFDLSSSDLNANNGSVSVLSGEWVARTSQGQVPSTQRFVLVVNGPAAGDGLGQAIVSLGDLDFDGADDLALGAPQYLGTGFTGPGFVEVVSGRSGAVLSVSPGEHLADGFGQCVAAAGDLDQDGVPDVVAGASSNTTGGSFAGMARVSSGLDLVGTPFCVSVPNSTGVGASIQGHGGLSISDNRLLLSAAGIQPGASGIFFYGHGSTWSLLGNGILCIGGSPLYRLHAVAANATGELVLPLDLSAPPVPAGTISPGSSWNFQAYFRDVPAGGAGFNLSNALTLTFVP